MGVVQLGFERQTVSPLPAAQVVQGIPEDRISSDHDITHVRQRLHRKEYQECMSLRRGSTAQVRRMSEMVAEAVL